MLPLLFLSPIVTDLMAPIVKDLIFNAVDSHLKNRAQADADENEKANALFGIYTMFAYADGVVEEAELAILYSAFNFLKKEDIDKRIKQYIQNPYEIYQVANIFFKKSDRISVFKTAYTIALVGDITESEEKKLCQIASLFGFSSDEILLIEKEIRESLLKKIAENAALVTQEEKEKILKRGSLLSKGILSNLSKRVYSALNNIDKNAVKNNLTNALLNRFSMKKK